MSIGHRLVVPDLHRPVAAVVEEGTVVRWLTWPTAPLPERAVEEAEAWPTGEGVWVVYSSDGIDEVTRTAVHLDPDRVGAAVDLGDRRVVAAEAGGLWLADPRDCIDVDGWHDDRRRRGPRGVGRFRSPVGRGRPVLARPAAWTEPDDDEDDADDAPWPDDDLEAGADHDPDDDGTRVMTAYQWSIGFGDTEDDSADGDGAADAAEPPGPHRRRRPPSSSASRRTARTTIAVDHLVEDVTVEGDG